MRTVTPPGSFIPIEERPDELHVPLSGPLDELTLKLFSLTLSFSPPGSAKVRRMAVLRVVRVVRVVTRRRTVFVVDRFAAGRAALRFFDVLLDLVVATGAPPRFGSGNNTRQTLGTRNPELAPLIQFS